LAFVWFYHGLVPKLLGPHPDELAINAKLGVSGDTARLIAQTSGLAELLLAGAMLLFWRQAWPLVLSCGLMLALLGFTAIVAPSYLAAAFNPVSTNISAMALAVVALILQTRKGKAPVDRQ
jgi:uncharacterized membrane protein